MNTIQYGQVNFSHNVSSGTSSANKNNEYIIGGGVGAATFATVRNSSKVGNTLVKSVKASKMLKNAKKTQVLELFSKFKPLAKHINNPIVKGVAGAFATMAAGVALIGSIGKIADTCSYLKTQA